MLISLLPNPSGTPPRSGTPLITIFLRKEAVVIPDNLTGFNRRLRQQSVAAASYVVALKTLEGLMCCLDASISKLANSFAISSSFSAALGDLKNACKVTHNRIIMTEIRF